MNMLAQFGNTEQSMTSLEIAELVEKRHDNVKRTIQTLVERRVITLPHFEEKATAGRPIGFFTFKGEKGKRDSIIVVAQLCPEFTARLVDRWAELEALVAKPQITTPQDYLSALKALVESEEQKQLVIQERDHAIATKAEIGSRREATAMGRLSAKVKEVESLKVQLDKSLDFASIKAVEIATGRKFGWHSLKKWSKANSSEIKTIPDPNFGEVKTYHKDAWLAVYSINLSSIRGGAA